MAHRSRKIAKRSSGTNTPTLGRSYRRNRHSRDDEEAALEQKGALAGPKSDPYSQPATHELSALVEELLDAHLDTIEMISERQSISDSELNHVRYLKALYRHGRATTAALADEPGATTTGT